MDDWAEYTGKTIEEAVKNAQDALDCKEDEFEYEEIEHESKGFLGILAKPAKIKARRKSMDIAAASDTADNVSNDASENVSGNNHVPAEVTGDPEKEAVKFLNDVFNAMQIETKVEAVFDKTVNEINININGGDMGVLIGKRGATLDSLQYLTSLVVNKGREEYIKIKLDTEDYRKRRKETLENLAKNLAQKAKRTHKSVALEPMNPYERRIIHSALQNDKFVETHSEGEEPYRKVVISLKKGVDTGFSRPPYKKNYGKFANKGGNFKKGGSGEYKSRYGTDTIRKYSKKEFVKKYGEETKDYSTDYKHDYEAYLEQKAAQRAIEGDKREKLPSPLYNPIARDNTAAQTPKSE